MVEIIKNWTIDLGFPENTAGITSWVIVALGVIIIAFLAAFITKNVLLVGVKYFVGRTKTQWDDFLLKRNVFTRLSHLAPAIVIYFTAYLFAPFDQVLQRFSNIYMILAGLLAVMAFLSAIVDIYKIPSFFTPAAKEPSVLPSHGPGYESVVGKSEGGSMP